MVLCSTRPPAVNEYQGYIVGDKSGRSVGLIVYKFWESQPPGALRPVQVLMVCFSYQ